MKTIEYLDEAKKKLDLVSDYKLARELRWSVQKMSQYRNEKHSMDPYKAAQLAVLLGKHPLELIAASCAERAKSEEEKQFWERLQTAVETETARRGEPLNAWWPGAESNCRHADFQSAALPTELPSHARPR
jgi:hypothetical protein